MLPPVTAREIQVTQNIDRRSFLTAAAGELPGCVAHCRFHALSFGDLNDPNSFVSKLLKAKDTVRIRPWLGTEPTLRYIPVVKTGVR